MNSLNMQASIHNLLQMDRHHEEQNRTPVIHQTQNADAASEEAAHRLEKPNEANEPEGKNVDSEANKRYQRERERKKKKEQKRTGRRGRIDGSGRFVDVTV